MSGSELSLHVLSWHATLYVPGKIGIFFLQKILIPTWAFARI